MTVTEIFWKEKSGAGRWCDKIIASEKGSFDGMNWYMNLYVNSKGTLLFLTEERSGTRANGDFVQPNRAFRLSESINEKIKKYIDDVYYIAIDTRYGTGCYFTKNQSDPLNYGECDVFLPLSRKKVSSAPENLYPKTY